MNKTKSTTIVSSFINQFHTELEPESCWKIKTTKNLAFDINSNFNVVKENREKNLGENAKFDFIIGDFSFGYIDNDSERKKSYKERNDWMKVLKSLEHLNNQGHALFALEPKGFGTSEGRKFEEILNFRGYYVNGIFNTPENEMRPETIFRPIFVHVSREMLTKSIFIAELIDNNQATEVVKNFLSRKDFGDLSGGMFIAKEDFRGFHHLIVKKQIEKLKSQYNDYEGYTLKELAVEINSIETRGGKYSKRDNCIYIPMFGDTPIISQFPSGGHDRYYQVVLREKVKNEYVIAFFRSKLGGLVLRALISGTTLYILKKEDLEQAIVAIPPEKEQNQIIDTHKKMTELKIVIDKLDEELALNPTNSNEILEQLDNVSGAIGNLTKADRVRNLVRQGETTKIEFKETMSLDVKKQKKEKYIENAVLKTIVAFLNSQGGILLIGISDDGNIKGIDEEMKKLYKNNPDKILLHFKNLIKEKIGEEYYPFIEYHVVKVNSSQVLIVECSKSGKPCFLDNKEFYVRTNPATDKLEGSKLLEYIKNHFEE